MDDDDYSVDCTEEELFALTEELLENDENNCAKYFRYNLQERRQGCQDVCEDPLFSDVDEALFEVPTIKKLLALHDNYEPNVRDEEEVTREEIQEERDFIDAILDTKVMDICRNFMMKKGLISQDFNSFRRFLHKIWFSLYPRARRNRGSCAFEHVFLGEVKHGKVNGFHNWLFFLTQEREGNVDYYGFNYGLGFGGRRGGVIKSVFAWDGIVKPVSGIFIGLSPELEMALYTLCVLLKPDEPCTVSLGGKTVDICNHIYRFDGKKYLGTAYPDL